MITRRFVIVGVAALGACARAAQSASKARDTIVGWKSESCSCCKLWVRHLEDAGFVGQVHDIDNMGPTKERVGIPAAMGSCHTGEVAGYFVEGHVPADDIKRLLRERPNAKGLTVPGMPLGSPGMEQPTGQAQPYDVLLVAKNGT